MTELQRALLRELVTADEKLAAELQELESLTRRAAAIRGRADLLLELFATAESRRGRYEADLADARSELAERELTLVSAEAELVRARESGDHEREAEARRFEVRARDALRTARRRVEAVEAERAAFALRLVDAESESPDVERSAAELAGELAARPRLTGEAGVRPGAGLVGVVEWASAARAALFVARTAVATEREGLIRQANELGSAILGEALSAASPAVVAARVGPG